ncbi:MAG: hypothetical protein IPI34_02570 [bacterium]|nr:hypothetical protein [bacterium]
MAIPLRSTRKATVQMQSRVGPFGVEGGVIWSGQPRNGESFQLVSDDVLEAGGPVSPQDIKTDTIKPEDTFGVRGKLTWQRGRWNWYGQGAYMGLVADAGPTAIPTYTGWSPGRTAVGNQVNVLTGGP